METVIIILMVGLFGIVMMIRGGVIMTIFDWCCAPLIHTYVELHHSDWWFSDCSEIEYVYRHFDDFKKWADTLGYKIECDPVS